jgi:hypothetical protein
MGTGRAKRQRQETAAEHGKAYEPLPGEIAASGDGPQEGGTVAQEVTDRADGKRSFREKVQLPDKLSIPAGEAVVQLIDKADNAAGIGIRILLPNGRKPTEVEREIIRRHVTAAEGERPTGFEWKNQLGMWLKGIGADSSPMRAVAIRLDAERRCENLSADLKEHYLDPEGFAARVRREREQAAQDQGIPL